MKGLEGATNHFFKFRDTSLLEHLIGEFTGNLIGNLTGEFIGNLTGEFIGNLIGEFMAQKLLTTSVPKLKLPN